MLQFYNSKQQIIILRYKCITLLLYIYIHVYNIQPSFKFTVTFKASTSIFDLIYYSFIRNNGRLSRSLLSRFVKDIIHESWPSCFLSPLMKFSVGHSWMPRIFFVFLKDDWKIWFVERVTSQRIRSLTG